MFYKIPTSKIDQLEEIVNRLRKKGVQVVFNKLEETIETGKLYIPDPITQTTKTMPIKVKCVNVEVSGSYKINGWEFIGSITFTNNGNIIRLANYDFESKIPEYYATCECFCDHCRTHRIRKETYLLYNAKSNEFKQVGSNCLLEYTEGLDAETCASMLECVDRIAKYSSDYSLEDWEYFQGANGSYGLDKNTTLKYAYALVKAYGYDKSKMSPMLMEYMFKRCDGETWQARYAHLKLATDSEIKAVSDWIIAQKPTTFSYLYNARLVWLKDLLEWRDVNYVCSLISTYIKEQLRRETTTSEHVGKVGDRITIECVKARVLYAKHTNYSYYGETTYVNEIVDVNGNIYVWSTTELVECYLDGDCIHDGEPYYDENGHIFIKATIKEHGEYKGVKQTIITRGKVLIP